MLTLIQQCDRMIARIEHALLIAAFSAITLILCAQVILRYFFNNPLFWAEEVSVQLLITATFIGLSYLTYLDQLVRVDLVLSLLNTSLRTQAKRCLSLLSLLTMLWVCVYATEWLLKPENFFDTSPTTGILKWYNYLTMVIGFYLMAFHMTIKVLLAEYFVTDTQPQSNEEQVC